ncbi:hypothetical protein HYV88_01740 [Candidatus Woesearchaeota archaeon]|nr:hypothetical protein [Candidatus Woesearchaeota archaeon]
MKRGTLLFLVCLLLLICLESSIVFPQEDNNILIDKCNGPVQISVNNIPGITSIRYSPSPADTEINFENLLVYGEITEQYTGTSNILSYEKIPNENAILVHTENNGDKVIYLSLDPNTDCGNIISAIQNNKVGQRESAQEVVHIEGRCTWASANIAGDPSAGQCSCTVDNNLDDLRILTNSIYLNEISPFLMTSRVYGPCPGPKSWDIPISTTTSNTNPQDTSGTPSSPSTPDLSGLGTAINDALPVIASSIRNLFNSILGMKGCISQHTQATETSPLNPPQELFECTEVKERGVVEVTYRPTGSQNIYTNKCSDDKKSIITFSCESNTKMTGQPKEENIFCGGMKFCKDQNPPVCLDIEWSCVQGNWKAFTTVREMNNPTQFECGLLKCGDVSHTQPYSWVDIVGGISKICNDHSDSFFGPNDGQWNGCAKTGTQTSSGTKIIDSIDQSASIWPTYWYEKSNQDSYPSDKLMDLFQQHEENIDYLHMEIQDLDNCVAMQYIGLIDYKDLKVKSYLSSGSPYSPNQDVTFLIDGKIDKKCSKKRDECENIVCSDLNIRNEINCHMVWVLPPAYLG